MNNYKISIIIPVYNSEKYISKTLESLIHQTIGFKYLQIILINDCSTDKCGEILNKFASIYENVVLIHLDENSGTAGRPRNVGLKYALADYLMFLDADDWFDDKACEILFDAISSSKSDIVAGFHSIVDPNGEVVLKNPEYSLRMGDVHLSLPDDLEEAFKYRYHFSNKIYKKSIITENRISFFEDNIGEDQIFLTNYLINSNSFHYINKRVLFYRKRAEGDLSISYNRNLNYFIRSNAYYKQMAKLLLKNRIHEDLYQVLLSETISVSIIDLIDAENLQDDEIVTILKLYRWIFAYSHQRKLLNKNYYVIAISEAVIPGNYCHALHILLALRLFRVETLQALAGKVWLVNQLENHKKALENLILVYDESNIANKKNNSRKNPARTTIRKL